MCLPDTRTVNTMDVFVVDNVSENVFLPVLMDFFLLVVNIRT